MKKILFPILTLVLALGLALPMASPVSAHLERAPQTVDLLAGKDINVGTVTVWNDNENLYVRYEVDEPWFLTETHLYVGKNIPPTSAPGQFPYGDDEIDYDSSWQAVIAIDDIDSYSLGKNGKGKKLVANEDQGVEPCDNIYIAAHASVTDFEQETAWADGSRINPKGNWATYFEYHVQPTTLTAAGEDNVSERSDDYSHTGAYSYHLKTAGDTGSGRATVEFDLPSGITLDDIQSVSWWTYLVSGYVPHMELYLDTDADNVADAILIAEGAYQNGDSTTGWPTGWFQTFDGVTAAYPGWAGMSGTPNLTQVDGTTAVWLSPSSYTPDQLSIDKLSVYQSAGGKDGVTGDTPVLYFQIEIDNWVAQTEVYVDDVEIALVP